MSTFRQQPIEFRSLFSPPYCALIIAFFIDNYQKKSNRKFPPALIHIILPLVLNEEYALCFINNPKKNFYHIVEANKVIYSTFLIKYLDLIDITNNALIILAETGTLIKRNEILELNSKLINKTTFSTNFKNELDTIKIISNIIAKIHDTAGIFITLDIRL
ncbi:hypothetical protein GCM10027155_09410 [Acinetobacter apis]|uniref:Uncharacterized protein n=1 Tax=Acinetobacter apis TaxID=1229165 RepID=A0A217EFN9_9GAMM|nr:three component ABC system middle component [Acinetobacter apis]SNQ29020.1 hypothetical protein SAMN05444584_0951 [Acinetobacter apis]